MPHSGAGERVDARRVSSGQPEHNKLPVVAAHESVHDSVATTMTVPRHAQLGGHRRHRHLTHLLLGVRQAHHGSGAVVCPGAPPWHRRTAARSPRGRAQLPSDSPRSPPGSRSRRRPTYPNPGSTAPHRTCERPSTPGVSRHPSRCERRTALRSSATRRLCCDCARRSSSPLWRSNWLWPAKGSCPVDQHLAA